ncbi:hypothetical protein HY627_02135 [Candidatus Uhrbacteria bacterium]|nr:hypothetical protein [Candidatus Uhrbacteria bacterium]
MDTQENTVKMSLPAIPPLVIGLVIGLAAGLVGGYVLPRASTTVATPQAAQGTQPPTAQAKPIGFYGKITGITGSTFMVQELLGANKPGEKTYTVTTTNDTKYTYQQPRDGTDAGTPPFTAIDGAIAELKQGWFVYVDTAGPITGESVTATRIIYSDKSPFKE